MILSNSGGLITRGFGEDARVLTRGYGGQELDVTPTGIVEFGEQEYTFYFPIRFIGFFDYELVFPVRIINSNSHDLIFRLNNNRLKRIAKILKGL